MKKITIIGSGYVGLVTGAGISDFGHKVTCVDILEDKIKLLKDGVIPIYEPGLEELIQKNTKAGRLDFSSNISKSIKKSEVIFIAVGTPQGNNGDADLSAIKSVAKVIGENLNTYKVICTKSTVPVGTGKSIIEIIDKFSNGNTEFDYVSNPEFLREGSAIKDFLWPDRLVVGAESQRAFNIMKEVYGPLHINDKPSLETKVVTAEMIKYASNSFLALKISYINEIANLCDMVGADIHQVANAMGKDGRISPKFLHPGPGFGGSCFPKDTEAFIALSKQKGINLNTIEAAVLTNKNQKVLMVKKLRNLVGGNFNELKIAILGLSFKPNTDDVRESASINMIKSILIEGGAVRAYDPIANQEMMKIFPNLDYFNRWEDACKNADAAVLMTEWNEFRAISIEKLKSLLKSPVLLDTRNIFSIKKLHKHKFTFDNVGRKKVT